MTDKSNFAGNIGYDDLREWLAMAERLGEVRTVKGANCEEDIGLAAEAGAARGKHGPCVVFEDIPGCAKGSRLLMNMFAGTRRNMTLSFPDHLTKWELSDAYREAYLQEQRVVPHVIVEDGPVLENVMMGDEVDVTKFPAPKWHEKDGGRYRHRHLQHHPRPGGELAQRRSVPGPGPRQEDGRHGDGRRSHGRIHRDKAFKRGEPLPAAMVLGGDPIAFFFGGLEAPYGVFELDLVGGLRGRPVKMVRGKVTGLPFPANAEIVLEGYVPPDRTHAEGPFGEWTGHYAGGMRRSRARHQGDLPPQRSDRAGRAADGRRSRRDGALPRGDALGHHQAERGQCRVPGVQAVWCHEVGGARMLHALDHAALSGTWYRPPMSPPSAAPPPMRRNTSWWWTTTSTSPISIICCGRC